MPSPTKNKTVQFNYKVKETAAQRLRALAKSKGMSVGELLAWMADREWDSDRVMARLPPKYGDAAEARAIRTKSSAEKELELAVDSLSDHLDDYFERELRYLSDD